VDTRRHWQAACLAAALSLTVTGACAADSPARYVPDPANLAAREWFQDAKFGIFLHWGLYSELGGVGSPGLSEWIMNDARIPAAKYERLAAFFNPVRFGADAWVRQFKGPIAPRPWGATTESDAAIYVHVLDWQDAELVIPLHRIVKRATSIDGRTVPMRTVSGGLALTLPAANAETWDRIIVLQK
jgi:Alpha-L-fucosidase